MEKTYAAPTLQDVKKVFGSQQVGRTIKVKPRNCLDAQNYIRKLNQAYRATKKSSIQFD